MADKAADAGKKAGKKNGKLLYGIVGVLVLAGAGGYWYTRPAAETQQDAKSKAKEKQKEKEAEEADYERSDVCAVSAASVIVESVVAFEVAAALVDKFGGDSIRELKRNIDSYRQACRRW